MVFLADDLREVARVGDLRAPSLALDPAALPAGLASGQLALWRVTAYKGRDQIARSATSPLTVP